MKILLITDSITECMTGIGVYTKNFISKLAKLETDNNYKLLDYRDFNLPNFQTEIIKNNFKFLKTYTWHNILPLKIKNLPYDTIFNFSGCPHLFPYKQSEVFFVYDISWLLFPKQHRLGRVLIFKLLFGRSLRNAKIIVVDSEHTKRDLIEYKKVSENKIFVIYPFLPTPAEIEKKPDLLNSEKFILFLGTLEPRKNIEGVIKAFKQLKEERKIEHKLVISGKKGWHFKSIYKLVEEYKLNSEVIFTGYISDEEKKYLLKNAELFVYPSHYEGFGIPVLEAMNHGCPVVTSKTSSLPEVVGNAGIMIDPNNTGEISSAMWSILSDVNLRDSLKLKGIDQSKKFKNEQQILNLLEHLKVVSQ
jgi:glycosyltransferase involved in cell wall biosynthesis